ncbi:MAG: hypothetical protein AMK73_06690 [Planctomycetes bacterium SM23_32]|nr:MAG: hypothetical protein AMK73_06690 [Planctomycetes bacterium SM23_32]
MLARDVKGVVDRYQQVAADRHGRVRDFYEGRRDFLVYTWPPSDAWGNVRTPEQAFRENFVPIHAALDAEMDALPYLEPWHGVGIYACSFGCENVWEEDQAPSTRVAFAHAEEALEFDPLAPSDNEMMCLVMETIAYFKERTGDALPIALTDTQSANDTATLVVDASNFMIECLTEPQHAHRLLERINASIITFSRMQADAIGEGRAGPGHIMPSAPGVGGIAVSDDNQSFCSADFSRRFTDPYNEALGEEFGGVALHFCGDGTHALPAMLAMDTLMLVDCCVHPLGDPNPNDPAAVAEAMAGSGKAVQMRCPGTKEAVDRVVEVVRPGLRLVLKFFWPGDAAAATELYHYATERLKAAYAAGAGD